MEVDLRPGAEIALSPPRVAVRATPGYEQIWAVSPNGDRFLRAGTQETEPFTLMLGWPSRVEGQLK